MAATRLRILLASAFCAWLGACDRRPAATTTERDLQADDEAARERDLGREQADAAAIRRDARIDALTNQVDGLEREMAELKASRQTLNGEVVDARLHALEDRAGQPAPPPAPVIQYPPVDGARPRTTR